MRENTTNLGLVKPDKVDQYNVADFNDNMQKIDDFAGLTPPRALTADKLTIGRNINGVLFDGTKDIEIKTGAGMPVGTIFAHTCAVDFVPENSLPCDGTEYSQSQFNDLYTDWLVGGRLNTCTYEEYQSDIDTYGKCTKFGLDSTSGKFKVPIIPDGTHIQQAMSDDKLGKSYKAGLPNIKGKISGNKYETLTPDNFNVEGALYVEKGDNLIVTSVASRDNDQTSAICMNASLSSSIYNDDVETVQTEAVALRYFVVVATGAINESEMNWSEWATGLQGKANVDMNNLSSTGKAEVTSYAFPSSKYDELELGLSGDTYIAPANGWFTFATKNIVENSTYLDASINNFTFYKDFYSYSGQNYTFRCTVAKNDILRIQYGGFTPSINNFIFLYAQGVSND